MRLRRPELHTLAGAYALDALSEADRARFERHLARPVPGNSANCARPPPAWPGPSPRTRPQK